MRSIVGGACVVVLALGCARGTTLVAVDDGGSGIIGVDGGVDAGVDAGTDAGVGRDGGTDAGSGDAGTDAGPGDAGTDGGVTFGGPGPWPLGNVTYGAADGIREQPIVGVTTDETQNLWVATNAALYLLKPGERTFRRFDANDSKTCSLGETRCLHLQNNPVEYCDKDFQAGDKACPIFGAAADPGITEIVGGGPNEVFVGYAGFHDWDASYDGSWSDPYRHTGMLDRVRLSTSGELQVDRFDMVAGVSVEFWHNRTVERMVYDHFVHKHELYVGTEHGVDKFSPDLFHPTIKGTWLNSKENNKLWMSDHLHPQTCYHRTCEFNPTELRVGDWRGLALTPRGDLWVAGRWTAGEIGWVADNSVWYETGRHPYLLAFGDGYTGNCGGNRPVFCPPAEGDYVDLSAVTVAPDGKVWFANSPVGNDPYYGIASFDGSQFVYYDPIRDAGMAELDVRDMLALPDGRLVLAGATTGLTFWNPNTGAHTSMRAGGGIPDDRVLRLELDRMVSPAALHVATWGGAAVLRVLP